MTAHLWQVTGRIRGHAFCAGIVTTDDRCTEAAPILRRTLMGRSRDAIREHAKRLGWTIRHAATLR